MDKYQVYLHQDGTKVASGDAHDTPVGAAAEVDDWNHRYRTAPPEDGSAFYETLED